MDRRRVADHAFLAGLADAELDAVARVASEREFAAGAALMSEGDFGHALFLVEAGSADVSVHGEKVAVVGTGRRGGRGRRPRLGAPHGLSRGDFSAAGDRVLQARRVGPRA